MNYEISMFFPVLKRGFVPIEFVPQSEINCLFFNVMLATYVFDLSSYQKPLYCIL